MKMKGKRTSGGEIEEFLVKKLEVWLKEIFFRSFRFGCDGF
jgi:hypothetical protein